jgi:hypothetical protein
VSRESVSEDDLAHYSLASPSAAEIWERKPKGGQDPSIAILRPNRIYRSILRRADHRVPRSCRSAYHHVYQPKLGLVGVGVSEGLGHISTG